MATENKDMLSGLAVPSVTVTKPQVEQGPLVAPLFNSPVVLHKNTGGVATQYEDMVDRQSKYSDSTATDYLWRNIPIFSAAYRELRERQLDDNSPAYNPTEEEFQEDVKYFDRYGKKQVIPYDQQAYIASARTHLVKDYRKQQVIADLETTQEQVEKNGLVSTVGLSIAGEVVNPANYVGVGLATKFVTYADMSRRILNANRLVGTYDEAKALVAAGKLKEAAELAQRAGSTAEGLSAATRFGRAAGANILTGVPVSALDSLVQNRDYGLSDFGMDVALTGLLGGVGDGLLGRMGSKERKLLDDRIAVAQRAYQADYAAKKALVDAEAAREAALSKPVTYKTQAALFDTNSVTIADLKAQEAEAAGSLVADTSNTVVKTKNGKDVNLTSPLDYMAYRLGTATVETPAVMNYRQALTEAFPTWSARKAQQYISEVTGRVNKAAAKNTETTISDIWKGGSKTTQVKLEDGSVVEASVLGQKKVTVEKASVSKDKKGQLTKTVKLVDEDHFEFSYTNAKGETITATKSVKDQDFASRWSSNVAEIEDLKQAITDTFNVGKQQGDQLTLLGGQEGKTGVVEDTSRVDLMDKIREVESRKATLSESLFSISRDNKLAEVRGTKPVSTAAKARELNALNRELAQLKAQLDEMGGKPVEAPQEGQMGLFNETSEPVIENQFNFDEYKVEDGQVSLDLEATDYPSNMARLKADMDKVVYDSVEQFTREAGVLAQKAFNEGRISEAHYKAALRVIEKRAYKELSAQLGRTVTKADVDFEANIKAWDEVFGAEGGLTPMDVQTEFSRLAGAQPKQTVNMFGDSALRFDLKDPFDYAAYLLTRDGLSDMQRKYLRSVFEQGPLAGLFQTQNKGVYGKYLKAVEAEVVKARKEGRGVTESIWKRTEQKQDFRPGEKYTIDGDKVTVVEQVRDGSGAFNKVDVEFADGTRKVYKKSDLVPSEKEVPVFSLTAYKDPEGALRLREFQVKPEDVKTLHKVIEDTKKAEELIEDVKAGLEEPKVETQEPELEPVDLTITEEDLIPDRTPGDLEVNPKKEDVPTVEELQAYEPKTPEVSTDVPEYLHDFVSKALRDEVLSFDGKPAVFESDLDKALAILVNKDHPLRGDALTLLSKMFDDLTEADLVEYAKALQEQIPGTLGNNGIHKVPKFWEVIDQNGPKTRVVEVEVNTHEDGSVSLVYRNGDKEDISAEHFVRQRGRVKEAAIVARDIENHERALVAVQDKTAMAELDQEIENTNAVLEALRGRKNQSKSDKDHFVYFMNRSARLAEVKGLTTRSEEGLRAQIGGLKKVLADVEAKAKARGKKHKTEEVKPEDVIRKEDGTLDVEATANKAEVEAAKADGWEEVTDPEMLKYYNEFKEKYPDSEIPVKEIADLVEEDRKQALIVKEWDSVRKSYGAKRGADYVLTNPVVVETKDGKYTVTKLHAMTGETGDEVPVTAIPDGKKAGKTRWVNREALYKALGVQPKKTMSVDEVVKMMEDNLQKTRDELKEMRQALKETTDKGLQANLREAIDRATNELNEGMDSVALAKGKKPSPQKAARARLDAKNAARKEAKKLTEELKAMEEDLVVLQDSYAMSKTRAGQDGYIKEMAAVTNKIAEHKKKLAALGLLGAAGAASADDGSNPDASGVTGLVVGTGMVLLAVFGGRLFRKAQTAVKNRTTTKLARMGERGIDRAFFGWGMASRVEAKGNAVLTAGAQDLMTNGAGSAGGVDVWKSQSMGALWNKTHEAWDKAITVYGKAKMGIRGQYMSAALWGDFAVTVMKAKMGHIKEVPVGVREAAQAMRDTEAKAMEEHHTLWGKLVALKDKGFDEAKSRARHFARVQADPDYYHLVHNLDSYDMWVARLQKMGMTEAQALGKLKELFEVSLRKGSDFSEELIPKLAAAKVSIFGKMRANVEYQKMSLDQLDAFKERLAKEMNLSADEIETIGILAEQGRKQRDEGQGATRSRLPWDTSVSVELPNGEKLSFMDLHQQNAYEVHKGYLEQITGDIALMKHTLEYYARTGVFKDFTHEEYFMALKDAAGKGSGDKVEEGIMFFDHLERGLYGMPVQVDQETALLNDVARVTQNIAAMRVVGQFARSVVVDPLTNAFVSPSAFLRTIPGLRRLWEDMREGSVTRELIKELQEVAGIGAERFRHVVYKENMGMKDWAVNTWNEASTGPGLIGAAADMVQNANGLIAKATFLNAASAWSKESTSLTYAQKILNRARKGQRDNWKFMEQYGVPAEMQTRIYDMFLASAEHTPGGTLKKLNIEDMKAKDYEAFLAYSKFMTRMTKARAGELFFTEAPPEAHSKFGKMVTFLLGAVQSTSINNLKALKNNPLDPHVAFIAGAGLIATALTYMAHTYMVTGFGSDQEEFDKRMAWDVIGAQAISRSNFAGWTSAYMSTSFQLAGYNDPLALSRSRGDQFGISAVQAANQTFKAAQSVGSLTKEDDEFTKQEMKNLMTTLGFNNILLPFAVNALSGEGQ